MPEVTPGTLYLVATPIGNLSDISMRAVNTLKDVDFIAAEDTRVTRKLLEHLEIKKTVVSYRQHNSRTSGEKILARLISGDSCALVTDAGTPGISDPGGELVSLCAKENAPMVVVPGPCAAVSALSMSGIDTGRFTFEGFLPVQKKERNEHLIELKEEKRTMVFYEAPHKLTATLSDLLKTLGNRRISISREMTKVYEETLRFSLYDALSYFENKAPRGEFVIVVEGADDTTESDEMLEEGLRYALTLIESGLSVKYAVKKAADETGCSKNALYKAVIAD